MKNDKKPLKRLDFAYSETLFDLGFGIDEAKIYEYILKNQDQKASEVASGTGISRVLTYRGLDKLVEKGVIEKIDEEGSPAYFSAKHPSYLSTVLEKQKRTLAKAEIELDRDLGIMSSDFNLATGKPNVQFYEGSDAVRKITSNFPSVDTEIRQWINIGNALKFIENATTSYLDIRIKNNIHKRMIVPDSEQNRLYVKKGSALTSFRILDTHEFPTSIQVYDDTISMLTLTTEKQIGVLITDPDIATSMKAIFDAQWNRCRSSEDIT